MIRVIVEKGEPVRFRTHEEGDGLLVMMLGFKGQEAPVGSFELRPSKVFSGLWELRDVAIHKDRRGDELEDRIWQAALQLVKQRLGKGITPGFSANSAAMNDLEERMWRSKHATPIPEQELEEGLREAEQSFPGTHGGKARKWAAKGLSVRELF